MTSHSHPEGYIVELCEREKADIEHFRAEHADGDQNAAEKALDFYHYLGTYTVIAVYRRITHTVSLTASP